MSIDKFVYSISYDVKLARFDILGSIAHTRMLAKCGIISAADAGKIVTALKGILSDLEKGKAVLKDEDVHTSVENELKKRIGELAGKMHTARSRNDQVVLDERLYLKEEIPAILRKIDVFIKSVKNTAARHKAAVMPGFTHLQNAQPVLFSHWILSYAWMLKRDKERFADCLKRVDVMPLGSAAFAGTEFPIDREFVAKQLGFAKVSENSVDSVSDRDFIAEFLSVSAITSMHLSRFAEDVIVWSSQQFGFVKLADEYTTGSSIMPQKKNPDYAELLRGKTGRIYGGLVSILTTMKGLPLSYNRDMQEDKEPMFDSADTVQYMLEVSAGMIESMTINEARMLSACENGFILATDLADYLVDKGLPFRTAYGIVKKVVAYCAGSGKVFSELSIKEWKSFSDRFDSSVFKVLDYKRAVEKRKSYGGTSSGSVEKQLKQL
jgi:argininosuccinate lyase